MARRSEIIELTDNGRTLRFEITQMPATKLHDWILRAVKCAGSSMNAEGGLEQLTGGITDNIVKNGPQILRNLNYAEAKMLIDDMLGTASRIVDNALKQPVNPETLDGYIEDVTTLFKLEKACFKVNLGFFLDALRSSSPSGESGKDSPQSPIRIPRQS